MSFDKFKVVVIPLIIIIYAIYDEVKLYYEPTADDNYIAQGYFQEYDNRTLILKSCTITHYGQEEYFDLFHIPTIELNSVLVNKMAKNSNKITVMYRYDKVIENRGLNAYYHSKIIRLTQEDTIIYQYDYQKSLQDGIFLIFVLIVLSILFYWWMFKDDK